MHVQSEMDAESPIWPWLIQYAGQVIYTFKQFRVDKRSARQRIRANPSVPEIPFSVKVYYLNQQKQS